MMRLRQALRADLVILFAVIFLLGQGLLSSWLFFSHKGVLQEVLRKEVVETGTYLASLAKSQEAPILDKIMEAFIHSGRFVSIKITNRENGFLLYKARAGSGDTVSFPVRGEKGNAGSVEITYSTRAIDETMKGFLVSLLGFSSITFLSLLFALLFYFEKKVSGPARHLSQAIERVSEGDLTVKLEEGEDDDIGKVTRGIHTLIEKLRSSILPFTYASEHFAGTTDQLKVMLQSVSDVIQGQLRSAEKIISALHSADDSQKGIRTHTDTLSGVSSENVSSLLEIRVAAEEIASSTGRLFKSTEDSYVMISEMSHMAQIIDDNTSEVSFAVGTTLVSVEEISASLNAVRENAKTSAGLVSLLKKNLADQGGIAVADAIHAMEKLVEEVNRSVEIITRLKERSKGIEKILSVIKEVTEKTNLLSLNAAILAVQAGGEFGKSFSVVADEIKALSDRTSSSAREISQIVRMIQEEIKEAVTTINRGAGKVEQGKDMIFRIGEAIGGTLEVAHKSTHMAMVIEKATDEQAEGLKQITLSMEKIRQMLARMTDATEEQKRGSGNMLESISEVKEVAELVKRGAEEHAKGTNLMSKNLEQTSEMVKGISGSALELQQISEGIVESVESMRDAWITMGRRIEEVMRTVLSLIEDTTVLRGEIGVYRTGSPRGSR